LKHKAATVSAGRISGEHNRWAIAPFPWSQVLVANFIGRRCGSNVTIFEVFGNGTVASALGQWFHMPKNTKNPPSCEACGRPTLLVRSERHPKFANMLQRVFVCRCGTSTTDIVAETSRRPVLSARTATTAIQGA
jgi:hypothetical protein